MQFFKEINPPAFTPGAAALITFLVTLSGVVIAGVGSAFWGVAAGALALFVQQYGQQRHAPLSGPVPITQTARSSQKP
ncbi:hypothetical protein BH10PSE16_BH10PSE16_13350 [soil metagenome]